MAQRRVVTTVVKRDGTKEPFDALRVRGCLLRVIDPEEASFAHADALAWAIRCYLRRRRIRCVSSAALLEMLLSVLRGVGMADSAGRLEAHYAARARFRSRLRVDHGEACTAWSKQWLVEHARRQWALPRPVARILAGRIEFELMERQTDRVARGELMEMLASEVAAWGLIAACPLVPADV